MDDKGKVTNMFYSSSAIEADNLARLALEAATQLDSLRRGHKGQVEVINKFADAVVKFAGISDSGHLHSSWLDPASSEMFSTAVAQSTTRKVYRVDALNTELQAIIDQLRKPSEDSTVDRMKAFCLSTHSFILRNRADSGLHERGVFDYDNSYSG